MNGEPYAPPLITIPQIQTLSPRLTAFRLLRKIGLARHHHSPLPTNNRHPLFGLAILVTLLIGLLLRLAFYLQDRTLWLDEVMIVQNFGYSWSTLFSGRLFYMQRAPLGWLLAQKFLHDHFTPLIGLENAVRLLSFFAATISFTLLLDSIRRVFVGSTRLFGFLLLACGWPTIYFAAETKPYAWDLLLATTVLSISILAQNRRLRPSSLAILGIPLAILPWFSVSGILWIACLLALLTLRRILLAPKTFLPWLLNLWWIPFALASPWWLGRSINPGETQEFRSYWAPGFFPLFTNPLDAPLWLWDWISSFFIPLVRLHHSLDFLGFPAMLILMALFILGIIHALRRPSLPSTLILLTLAASLYLSLSVTYPPIGRLSLLLYPAFLWILLLGAQTLEKAYPPTRSILASTLFAMACLALYSTLLTLSSGIARTDLPPRFASVTYYGIENFHEARAKIEPTPGPKTALLIPTFTKRAFFYYLPNDPQPIPSQYIWFEENPPFHPRIYDWPLLDVLEANPEFTFGTLNPQNLTWELSPALKSFCQVARNEERRIILFVSHGSSIYHGLALAIAQETHGIFHTTTARGIKIFLITPNTTN